MRLVTREDLVGTVFEKMLLINFKGEGTNSVVYGVASPDDETPQDSGEFLKLSKEMRCFEMSVLHHSFRVHERLYPNHPLRLSPEERMRLLKEEMLDRIKTPRLALRAFSGIYRDLFAMLGQRFGRAFRKGTLPEDFLSKEQSLQIFADDDFCFLLEELIEKDQLVDEWVPFAEHLLQIISSTLPGLKNSNELCLFSDNALCKLVALLKLDFISPEEFVEIGRDEALRALVTGPCVDGLGTLIIKLYQRAEMKRSSLVRNLPREDLELFQSMASDTVKGITDHERLERILEKWESFSDFNEVRRTIKLVMISSQTLLAFADLAKPLTLGVVKHILALCAWWNEEDSRAVRLLEAALKDLRDDDEMEERYLVLLSLHSILKKTAPSLAKSYLQQAKQLKK